MDEVILQFLFLGFKLSVCLAFQSCTSSIKHPHVPFTDTQKSQNKSADKNQTFHFQYLTAFKLLGHIKGHLGQHSFVILKFYNIFQKKIDGQSCISKERWPIL